MRKSYFFFICLVMFSALLSCGGTGSEPRESCDANAGPDQGVPVGATVTLDGSQSFCSAGNTPITDWTFTDWPGSKPYDLPSVPHPTFVATEEGIYKITLKVTDTNPDSPKYPGFDDVVIYSPELTVFGDENKNIFHSIKETADGGYIAAGYREVRTFVYNEHIHNWYYVYRYDNYLVKMNEVGELEWEKTYDGYGKAYSVIQTADAGYLLVGDFNIIKTDTSGNVEWETLSDAQLLRAVEHTVDGSFVLAGKKMDQLYLTKIDIAGNQIWESILGTQYESEGHSVRQTPDGGYIVAGKSKQTSGSYSGVYMVKTDALGNLEWDSSFGGITSSSSGTDIQLATDGGYAISGLKSSDMYLAKTDTNGTLEWDRTYLTNLYAYYEATSLQVTNDGGYVMTGPRMALVKTDISGILEWASVFDRNVPAYGFSLLLTSDSNYVIAGQFSRDENLDACVVKTDGVDIIW